MIPRPIVYGSYRVHAAERRTAVLRIDIAHPATRDEVLEDVEPRCWVPTGVAAHGDNR